MAILKNFLTTALVLASASLAAQAEEKVSISYSTGSFAFMPFFAADALGYFDKTGIKVELVKVGSATKSVAAVAGDVADLTVLSGASMLFARQEGIDLQMFGILVNQYTTGVTYSAAWAAKNGITEESPLDAKFASLRGSRIATSGPGGGDDIIRYLARRAGLDPDRDMTIIHLGADMGVFLAALKEGRVDGIALSEPIPHIAKRDLDAIVAFNLPEAEVPELDGFPYISIMGRRDWLAAHPETARKIYGAIAASASALKDGVDTEAEREAVRAAYYPDVDPALFAQIWPAAVFSIPDTPAISSEDVTRLAQFLIEAGHSNVDLNRLEGASTMDYALEKQKD